MPSPWNTSPAPRRSFFTSSTNDLSAMSLPGPGPDVRTTGGPTLEAGRGAAPRAGSHAEEEFVKDELVYPREVSLGAITLVLGLIGWLLLVVLTLGIALVYLLFGFLFYLFAHSASISWLRGNAV